MVYILWVETPKGQTQQKVR